MTSNVVADNSHPLTTILITSPRGKAVQWIIKMLLELEKGLLLAFDAMDLKLSAAEEVGMNTCNNEQAKENECIHDNAN